MGMTPSTDLRALIDGQAERFPEQPAVLAPDRRPLTYAALAGQVHRGGAALRALGIGPGDAVAAVLPNGPEFATAFVTIAAYAACAPLNPAFPEAEFDFFLGSMNAAALVVAPGDEGPAVTAARARGVRVIELEPEPAAAAGTFTLRPRDAAAIEAPADATGPEAIAMVLFTSGTTATPRQVPLTQRNLVTAATNTGRFFELGPTERCLNVMPLYHAHGLVSTLLASLAHGASVVCTPGFDDRAFFQWLGEFEPTWYSAVPAMHAALLDTAPAFGEVLSRVHLRLIRSASAPLAGPVLDRLEQTFRAPVIEAYGMTEAGSLVTSNPLPPGPRKRGSVGIAVEEPVTILDEAGQPAPAGQPGEIAIRGGNVMHGYAHDPAANAVAFVDGALRTGDYGYLDEDGYLFIIGRVKEIINRGGSKVSPAQVDEALVDHPGLAQVAAFALPHPTLGEDVAVAVVLRPGHAVTEREIREYAAARLADYKVPSRVFMLDAIPRNATGKVQRLKLTERFSTTERVAAAPTSASAAAIATIWSEVLGVSDVGPTENFFDLGGSSLMLTRVAERLARLTGRDVSPAALAMHPTVAAIVEFLATDHNGVTVDDGPAARLAAGRARLRQQLSTRSQPREAG